MKPIDKAFVRKVSESSGRNGSELIGGKQRQLQSFLENKEKRRVLQKLTQFGGVQCYKDELRQALAEA